MSEQENNQVETINHDDLIEDLKVSLMVDKNSVVKSLATAQTRLGDDFGSFLSGLDDQLKNQLLDYGFKVLSNGIGLC